MKQFIIGILLIIAGIALWACKISGHQYIEFVNKSNKMVAFQYFVNRPDTSFWCTDNAGRMILIGVRPGSTFMMESDLWSEGWEGELKKGELLSILVADQEIWDQYWKEPCDTIRKYVSLLHHYRLSVEDLEQMNWMVVYPPEE